MKEGKLFFLPSVCRLTFFFPASLPLRRLQAARRKAQNPQTAARCQSRLISHRTAVCYARQSPPPLPPPPLHIKPRTMEDDAPSVDFHQTEEAKGLSLAPSGIFGVEIVPPEPEWIDRFFAVSEIETQDVRRFVEKCPMWAQQDQSFSELYELAINDIVHERLLLPINNNFTSKENVQLSILLGSEGCGKSIFLRSLFHSSSSSSHFFPLYVSAVDLFRAMERGHATPLQQLFQAVLVQLRPGLCPL